LGGVPRVAVVGIGHPFRSDDAAGLRVVHALAPREWSPNLLICDAGPAPENTTGELRAFAPDLIIFIDAAEMSQQAGTVQWVAGEGIDGMSASTHSLPLSVLTRYLTLELNCRVVLLGIQPGSNEVGEMMSAPVSQAVEQVTNDLFDVLAACTSVEFQAHETAGKPFTG
jgi:hydrogenase 3 maturation protease